MLEAVPEPVELPDHERIAGPHVGQGFLQAGLLSFDSAGLVGVDLLAVRGLQGILLVVEVLLVGRDPADHHHDIGVTHCVVIG